MRRIVYYSKTAGWVGRFLPRPHQAVVVKRFYRLMKELSLTLPCCLAFFFLAAFSSSRRGQGSWLRILEWSTRHSLHPCMAMRNLVSVSVSLSVSLSLSLFSCLILPSPFSFCFCFLFFLLFIFWVSVLTLQSFLIPPSRAWALSF